MRLDKGRKSIHISLVSLPIFFLEGITSVTPSIPPSPSIRERALRA